MVQPSAISYIQSINAVQDYIENHLDQPLTAKELCQVANFSEFHFQRIFGFITGESLYGFIKRIRLEKATYMLLADPKRSILDIALSVGFSSQASFAKAFKNKYGITSTYYRKTKGFESREVGLEKEVKESFIEPLEVKVKNEKSLKLIYTRYTGVYKGDATLFSRLFEQVHHAAKKRDLISSDSRWFVIYHDSGSEVEEHQLRLSVCMSVDKCILDDDEINIMTLAPGKYGVGKFLVEPQEYRLAWKYMYTKWLPESGYRGDDRYALEHYPPFRSQDKKRLVEIYIPPLFCVRMYRNCVIVELSILR